MGRETRLCGGCGKETTNPKYCSRSCSVRTTNSLARKPRPSCRVCGRSVNDKRNQYCSKPCARAGRRQDAQAVIELGAKECLQCGQEKPLSAFNRQASALDGHQRFCRTCNSEYFAEWEKADPSRDQRLRRPAWKSRATYAARDYIFTYLKEHPCVDCGFSDPRALDFDHVTGSKRGGVFELAIRGNSVDVIKEEISKCEVRCTNCHRIVTAVRGNWWSAHLIHPEEGSVS